MQLGDHLPSTGWMHGPGTPLASAGEGWLLSVSSYRNPVVSPVAVSQHTLHVCLRIGGFPCGPAGPGPEKNAVDLLLAALEISPWDLLGGTASSLSPSVSWFH